MSYVRLIPVWFSARKAAQVTAFFIKKAGGKINILRATKLIYLADRRNMEMREHPITGDDFVSMRFGPVNSYTYSLMNGEGRNRQHEWAEFVRPRLGTDLTLARQINNVPEDLDELSRADLRILDETWEKFSVISDQFQLAKWTHKYCPEWRDPNGSSIPIDFSTVFKKLKKERPIELAEQIQAERAFLSSLISN